MSFQVVDQNNESLDAHFDIDGNSIVFYSRSGSKNASNRRNTQYGEGLRAIIARLKAAGIGILEAAVDSSAVVSMPIANRTILGSTPVIGDVNAIYVECARRMANVRAANAGSHKGGNSTKRIRIQTTAKDAKILQAALNGIPVKGDFLRQDRLPAEMLNRVCEQHVYNAVELLRSGGATHPFGESTDFDVLLEDGVRLPPKAVFGIASKEALGMEVLPKHFSGGEGTICFRIIKSCGYKIVPKGDHDLVTRLPKPAASAELSDEDRDFAEGGAKRIEHLTRERHPGASKAKKAAFKAKHGILFCERCKMKPIEVYGSELGEACIEVHHTKPIAEMKEGGRTKLEDLQCLCASCHRVVHRELRIADSKNPSRSADSAPFSKGSGF